MPADAFPMLSHSLYINGKCAVAWRLGGSNFTALQQTTEWHTNNVVFHHPSLQSYQHLRATQLMVSQVQLLAIDLEQCHSSVSVYPVTFFFSLLIISSGKEIEMCIHITDVSSSRRINWYSHWQWFWGHVNWGGFRSILDLDFNPHRDGGGGGNYSSLAFFVDNPKYDHRYRRETFSIFFGINFTSSTRTSEKSIKTFLSKWRFSDLMFRQFG